MGRLLSKTEVLNCTFHRRGVVGVGGGGAGVGGRECEFSSSIEIRTGRSKRVTYPQSSARIVEQKRRFEWVPRILKAELSTTQPVFRRWSQTTALFRIGVLGSQGGTLYLLNTWLPFRSCPSSSRGNYCNCHFFCSFSSKEENAKSFLCPQLFILSAVPFVASPRARRKLCPLQL